ncbi:MAG: DUF3168 domain-containing protein [Bacteroides sp.]|jgi:hypothetical protein|nr:DUF3168 domain-containing protein [Bacteroides sp.]
MITTPKPKFKITTDLKNILLEDQEIADIIEGRTFPVFAEEDTAGTFITYQRDKYSAPLSKMGAGNDSCFVFITAVSDDYDISQDLAEKIYYVLFGEHKINGVSFDASLEDSTEDCVVSESGKKYLQTLLFKIE